MGSPSCYNEADSSSRIPRWATSTAKATKRYGFSFKGGQEQEPFFVDPQNMIVKLPDERYISAFQPLAADQTYRLGWPFLMNNITTFNVTSVPATLNLTQKAPLA